MQIQVKTAENSDLTQLESALPFGMLDKHAERLQRQSRGEVVYLIAWCAENPVGHGLLKWGGATEDHIASHMHGMCPDVEDMFVVEGMRSKGVGTQILKTAERLVLERGFAQIGLSVNVMNDRARMLYQRLGYLDAGLGEYDERGEYVDSHGQVQTWGETCIYLVKQLKAS